MFELLGQSVRDPVLEQEGVPVVLRSWQAQNFLVTALHVKSSASNLNANRNYRSPGFGLVQLDSIYHHIIFFIEIILFAVKNETQECNLHSLQELLPAEGTNMPHNVHEVIAHLTTRLARCDDR